MKNTKIITVSLAAALAIGAITANGVLVSADAEKGTIKVAASATPHAEILEEAKPILEKEGWDLEVTVFDDYVQPNLVVESGDFDANYFQHIPYLDNFNEEQGTHLVNAGGIHYEPFGIYVFCSFLLNLSLICIINIRIGTIMLIADHILITSSNSPLK